MNNNDKPEFTPWVSSKVRIGNWEPQTDAERAMAFVIGGAIALGGIILALLAIFGIGLPVLGIGLAVVLGAVALVVVIALGAALLPVLLLLSPIALVLWLIFR